MRLLVYYAIQIAVVVAGFTAVSIAFVTINSNAMSNVANQLVSEAALVAVNQVVEPLNKFSVQVKVFADTLTSMPHLQGDDPTQPQWNESPSVAFDPNYMPPLNVTLDPSLRTKLAIMLNNPLAMYAYESFEMPDNKTQWADNSVSRTGSDPRSYYTLKPSFRRHPVDPLYVICFVNASDMGNTQLTPSLVDPGYRCEYVPEYASTGNPWQIEAKAMTVADGATGKWTSFYTFLAPDGQVSPLLTFSVPIRFSKTPDPELGRIYTTNAAMMDLNAQFLSAALTVAKSSLETIDLALFWDKDDTMIAWTLPQPGVDPADQSVLSAGATGTKFDDAVRLFFRSGWCNESTPASARAKGMALSLCTPPADASAVVSDETNIFALRRVTHINAKFSIIISGSRSSFFGPGERARGVGIGVSVATCGLAVVACVLLWVAIARPLSRLITKMQSAARFEDLDEGEANGSGGSAVTEIAEADDAFKAMHAQLLAAKPFMPRHLLIALGGDDAASERSEPRVEDHKTADRRQHVDGDRISTRSSASKRPSVVRSVRSDPTAVAARHPMSTSSVMPHDVAVLVCNLNHFTSLSQQCTVAELQSRYGELIDVIGTSATMNRGVIDSVQGDHVMITFNSATRCANPSARAVRTAFDIRDGLSKRSQLPAAWLDVTFGIASSKALCGPMGTATLKSHATLGTAMRAAVGLQRLARANTSGSGESATAAGHEAECPVSDTPQWCMASGSVAAECTTFAHFRHMAVVKLPPQQSAIVVTALCPPVASAAAAMPAAVDATMGDGEWLYEVQAIMRANPWLAHNADFERANGVESSGRLQRRESELRFVADPDAFQRVLAVCGPILMKVQPREV